MWCYYFSSIMTHLRSKHLKKQASQQIFELSAEVENFYMKSIFRMNA